MSKYTLDDCINAAKIKGGECLSKSYNSLDMTFKCAEGHVWNTYSSNVVSKNHWCDTCSRRSRDKVKRTSKMEVETFVAKKGMKLLDSDYKNNKYIHNWECEKGHQFKKPYSSLKLGVGCPDCCNTFTSENRVRSIVEKVTGVTFNKIRPSWLVYNVRPLELDGFSEELKVAFEFDGQFHFEVRPGINNDLEKTRTHDHFKNEVTKMLGIKLIRIPYFKDSEDEIIVNLLINDVPLIKGIHINTQKQWEVLRGKRDKLLQETDKMMLADYPIETKERSRVRDYRQYLRDLPKLYSEETIHLAKVKTYAEFLDWKRGGVY